MKLAKFLVPVAALALLAGCATGGAQGPAAPAVTPGAEVSGEITVWSWDIAAVSLERLATEFQKKHAGTTVKVVDVGYDNAYDKISVGLQAGSGLPDVLTIETDRAPGYINEFPKGFVDLDPIFSDKKADYDPFKWSAQSNSDGQLMMAPWDSGTVGLYYRTDYLKDAGVDPASLKTWDDFLAAGEAVKSKTGHTMISIDVSTGGTFQMLLQQQGQGLFNDAGEITVNTPEAIKALTLLKELNDKGYLKNVQGWDGRVTSAKDGDSAFTVEAVWWAGTLESDAPELSGKYAVTELPGFSADGARTSNNGGSGLAVPSQAKNPELAAAFVDYVLADKANVVSMMTDESLFPSYLPAFEDPYFAKPQEYFGGQPIYELFAKLTATIPAITFTTDNAKATDIVGNAVVASVLNGQDPAEALKGAADQIATATGRKIAG